MLSAYMLVFRVWKYRTHSTTDTVAEMSEEEETEFTVSFQYFAVHYKPTNMLR
jgi:hypothetical protein